MKNKYLLLESLVSTVSVYLILKKLTTEWSDWDAFKLGIIDKNGNKLKNPISSKEREAWDILTRLCWNLKKVSSKFLGKEKFAQYFSAAYLMKDSLNSYIIINQVKLNETLLSDLTCTKQNVIYNIIKELSVHQTLVEPQHYSLEEAQHETLELAMYKILNMVEDSLKTHNAESILFEDATVAGDVAQHSQMLGTTKRTNPLKLANKGLLKLKKKKKDIEHESN